MAKAKSVSDIQALDEACEELENPRLRVKFYDLLTDKLGPTIAA